MIFASDADPGAIDLALWLLIAVLAIVVHLWRLWLALLVLFALYYLWERRHAPRDR